jgi:nucleolar protein 14
MGAYLGLGRVRSLGDIASGLFLCTLFLQYEALSKRLVPEAVNLLVNAVLHLAPHPYRDASDLPGLFPSPDFRSDLCTPLLMNTKARKSLVVRKAELLNLMTADNDDEQAKSDLLLLAFHLLGEFADLYKAIDGFVELYEPIISILNNLETKKLFDGHKVGNLNILVRIITHSRFSVLRHNYPNSSILSSD